MASRRSRMFGSSSLGEVGNGLFTKIHSIEPPLAFFERKPLAPVTVSVSKAPMVAEKKKKNKKKKQQQHQQKPGRNIFYVESPEREKKNDDAWSVRKQSKELGFGEAFKTCFLCRKKLAEGQELYMYRYLAAFCSPECREDQIALDGFDKEIAKDVERIHSQNQLLPNCKNF